MPERLPLILILPWRRDVAAPPFATSIPSSSFVSRESDNEMNHAVLCTVLAARDRLHPVSPALSATYNTTT